MTVTVEEAKANLSQIVAKAEAGEEIMIGLEKDHPTVKLVPLVPKGPRFTPHPELAKVMVIHDHEALVKPLPPEEWGGLADG